MRINVSLIVIQLINIDFLHGQIWFNAGILIHEVGSCPVMYWFVSVTGGVLQETAQGLLCACHSKICLWKDTEKRFKSQISLWFSFLEVLLVMLVPLSCVFVMPLSLSLAKGWKCNRNASWDQSQKKEMGLPNSLVLELYSHLLGIVRYLGNLLIIWAKLLRTSRYYQICADCLWGNIYCRDHY